MAESHPSPGGQATYKQDRHGRQRLTHHLFCILPPIPLPSFPNHSPQLRSACCFSLRLMISAPLLRVPAAPNRAAVGAPFRLRAPPSSSGSRPSNARCAAPPQAAAAAAAAAAATPYDVLGLRAGATAREIKAAYRRLARERHPDAAPGAAAAEFVRLHDAYATLSDPDSRARYDRAAVPAQRPRPGWAAARPRRTWETDQCW
ncbi:hypothetical protein BS78_07G219200 [Paspalum vaginatum]|nr:hypothetical protein BS78_07G219200 [Paspalum vaginatum]